MKYDWYQILSILIVTFLSSIFNVYFGILIMTKGWGIEVKNYGWIVGGGLFISLMAWAFGLLIKILWGDKE